MLARADSEDNLSFVLDTVDVFSVVLALRLALAVVLGEEVVLGLDVVLDVADVVLLVVATDEEARFLKEVFEAQNDLASESCARGARAP